MTLRELFADGDYRFQMALRRGSAAEFFSATPERSALLAERQRWLGEAPQTYSACLPEAGPVLHECIELAFEWQTISTNDREKLNASGASHEPCISLGRLWEPDFLLLQRDASGEFVLLGGCVCFPSAWSLTEKIGRPMGFIHEAVPGLNAQIGRSIHSFLGNLTPESAWLRHNWGLTRSPELNQHPSRKLPRLNSCVTLDEVWLRVEHQCLSALPRSGGLLFGIRIATHPLATLQSDVVAAQHLARALRTMPENIAVYKGIAPARQRLLNLLGSN